MIESKESRIYLRFFKENAWFIIAPGVFFIAITLILASFYFPRSYHQDLLLEIRYTQEDIKQKVLLTDEAVQLIRSYQIQQQLGINPQTTVRVYKSGPLLINIDLATTKNPQVLEKESALVKGYLFDRFQIAQIGEIRAYDYSEGKGIFTLGGILSAFSIGIITALVKTYFSKY